MFGTEKVELMKLKILKNLVKQPVNYVHPMLFVMIYYNVAVNMDILLTEVNVFQHFVITTQKLINFVEEYLA